MLSKRVELWLLLLVLAVAALLRLFWLDQVPPGWHHDEALMGVMASEVLRGVQRPIFFPGYAGQEPLYIYVASFAMAVLRSEDILPVRLTSAAFGLGTVFVAYLLGKAMFNRRVGLLAAALLGTSFWQVLSSRSTYRSISEPLVEGLAVYFLWRARQELRTGWYIASGATFAGATYTYLAGRSFPAVLVAFIVWSLLFEKPSSRGRAKCWLALVLAAVVVAAPIYLYWLANPESYTSRMNQVFILNPAVNHGQPLSYLLQSAGRALMMFTIHGDDTWRFNLPGRPIFEWPIVAACYVGTVAVLWKVWRRDAAATMLALWIALMILPSLLSYDEGGYSLRAMALVPAIYLIPAAGIDAIWVFVIRRWQHRRKVIVPALTAVIAMVLAIDGGLTFRDYFFDWSRQFSPAYDADAQVVAEARYLAANAEPGSEDVFAGSEYRGHPIIAQLAPKVYKDLRWLDGRQSIVYSPDVVHDSLYVLSLRTLPPDNGARYFPQQSVVAMERFATGIDPSQPPPKFMAFKLSPEQVRAQVAGWLHDPATTPLNANVGGEVLLMGAQVPGNVVAAHTLPVTVVWKVLKSPSASDYVFFSHLIDDQGVMSAQRDVNGYPTPEWRPGDIVVGRYDLEVPELLDPGKYQVDIGVYDRSDGRRLMVQGPDGRSTAVVATVKVQPMAPPQAPGNLLDQRLGKDITIAGYDVDRTGGGVSVRLVWRVLDKPSEDYTVFVQLLGPDGKLVVQSDAMPASNRFPTSLWDAGDVVADVHRLALPSNPAPGYYRLIAGMYLLKTGRRLAVDSGDDYVSLGEIALP